MIPGQNANDLLAAIQNGVAGVTVFQHHIPHGIHPVVQVEADHVLGIADPLHRDGLENQPRRPEGVVGVEMMQVSVGMVRSSSEISA